MSIAGKSQKANNKFSGSGTQTLLIKFYFSEIFKKEKGQK
jgi:hypothetical protein